MRKRGNGLLYIRLRSQPLCLAYNPWQTNPEEMRFLIERINNFSFRSFRSKDLLLKGISPVSLSSSGKAMGLVSLLYSQNICYKSRMVSFGERHAISFGLSKGLRMEH